MTTRLQGLADKFAWLSFDRTGFATVLRTPHLRSHMYTYVGEDAPWRHDRITHEKFVAANLGTLSPWFCVPGMRLELVYFDLMHVGPLGIFRSLAAGVIWNMVQRGELRNLNDELALRLLWQEFRQFCKNNKLAPPSGTLSKRLLGDFTGKLHGAIFGSMEWKPRSARQGEL